MQNKKTIQNLVLMLSSKVNFSKHYLHHINPFLEPSLIRNKQECSLIITACLVQRKGLASEQVVWDKDVPVTAKDFV